MKITQIRLEEFEGTCDQTVAVLEAIPSKWPQRIRQSFLFLETDEAVTGCYGPVEIEPFALRQLAPAYLGGDPIQCGRLWNDAYLASFRHGHKSHHVLAALSALDNAAWDLRGRSLGLPVCRILGGPTRNEVRAYASCIAGSSEPELAREQANAVRGEGWTAQKWFLWGHPRWSPGRVALEHHTQLATAIRDGAGPDYELMFDGVMTWDQNYALQLCRRLTILEPLWIEEAVASNQLEGFRRLKRETGVALAAGEHLYTRWDVKPYLEDGVLDFLQCDPEWTGGISEMMRICAMASAWGVKVVPHGHNVTAALQIVAAQPEWVCPMIEYLVHFASVRQHFHARPLQVHKGRVEIPAGPGMGFELDARKIARKRTVLAIEE